MNIERDLYQELIAWKDKKSRKPLLLQGARQVGKTWLLKHFGENEFDDVAYFNFDEKAELKQFFEITKDPIRILSNLSIVHGKAISADKTLIIFDEIQECNEALNALKYFKENTPEYAVIGSGSFLGLSLSGNKSFPVGQVEFLTLYPVSFKEFLAKVDINLHNYLLQLNEISPIPDIFFNQLKDKLRQYFITGGMPEAIKTMLESNNIQELEKIQQNILNAYELDFSKHINTPDIPKTKYVWSSIPSQLSRENKKFLYQTVKKGARAREYENALLWLKQAGLVHIVNRINKPAFPISAYSDLSAFKAYLLDVGLLRQLANLKANIIDNDNALFTEFKGSLTENYILQSLVTLFQTNQYYWTSGNKAEVDFIIQYQDNIIPIEVKAAESVKSKSLLAYANKYNPKIKIRYSLKNLSIDDNLINIPLFMVDFTKSILDSINNDITKVK